MLKHLYIKDYIIIDELNIDFSSGMSVFTGETGAGKSIIIDAISLLCGERLSGNVVRNGSKKAILEAVFTVENSDSINVLLNAGVEEADEYVLSREITADGKSTVRLNYRVITAALAKEIMSPLVDIHNQHGTQYLLNSRNHLHLLDRFQPDNSLLERVKAKYKEYAEKKKALEDALSSDYNEDDREYLEFQKNEIENSNLTPNEQEELEDKQKKMMAFEKTSNTLNDVLTDLKGNDGAIDRLYSITHTLGNLNNEDLTKQLEKLNDFYYEIQDITEEINDYLNSLSYDEDELNQIQARLYEISRLRRKYGNYDSMMNKLDEINQRLELMDNRDEFIAKAEKEVKAALDAYTRAANELSIYRSKNAKKLETAIQQQLKDLQLPKARFVIDIQDSNPSANGSDSVEFLLSTNVGQAVSPLVKVASGGELSRVMLGLKTIFNQLQGISTVIFDEIDSGVSGEVATSIGLKMHDISLTAQVFSITHLAQVAACADQHYFVSKSSNAEMTTSVVTELNEEQRIEQLALVSSSSKSDAALNAARELFNNSQRMIQKSYEIK